MSFFTQSHETKCQNIHFGIISMVAEHWTQPAFSSVEEERSILWGTLGASRSNEKQWIRYKYTVRHHLTTGIHFEKFNIRRFCGCVKIIEYTSTNLDDIAYTYLGYMV